MKKNGKKMGRPKLPDQEKVVKDSTLFLLPREWAKLRSAAGVPEDESASPILQQIVRDWISKNA